MFLLDTNVISELRKQRPHGGLLAWFLSVPVSSLALPSVAFYEMQAGVELTRERDPGHALDIETWVQNISEQSMILNWDCNAARETARIMAGRSADVFEDAMIAAIARVNGCTVATRNIKHFRLFNVPLINPFEYGKGTRPESVKKL